MVMPIMLWIPRDARTCPDSEFALDGRCWTQGALPGLSQTFHLNLPAAIYPSPEGARGKSWLLELHGVTGQIRYAGWYDYVYVRTPAGWRFKSRNHRTDFSYPGPHASAGVGQGAGVSGSRRSPAGGAAASERAE